MRRGSHKRPALLLRSIPLLLAALAAVLVFRPGEREDVPANLHFPAPDAFQSAMTERNAAFTEELDQVLAAHPDEHAQISGPDGGSVLVTNWRDIASVYVARAGSDALDAGLLEDIFREMVAVTFTETTALFPHMEQYPSANGTLREVEIRAPEPVIQVAVACKTAGALEDKYAARLDALLGRSLPLPAVANTDLAELPPLRRNVVRSASALVDRVAYFWGGKSDTPGWDPLWGAPAVVASEGSGSTGSVRPLGLDCSGLVSWCAVTAAGAPSAYALIGDGVRDQFGKCTPIPWADIQPGDLVFFPDLSHVGIAAGFSADGRLRVVHCSSTLGGVVLSEDAAAIGFTDAGQPEFYE